MADYENTLLTEIKISAEQALSQLSKMSTALNKVSGDVAKVGHATDGLVTTVKGLGAAFAAIRIGEWVTQAVKGFGTLIQNTADLADAAERLGVSTQALQGLGYAAVQGATDAKTLETALGNLQTKMSDMGNATTKASQYLKQIGVKEGDSTEEAFNKIADAAKATGDSVAVAGAMAAIFGKEMGLKLIPMLKDGRQGLAAMKQEAEKLGIVLDDATIGNVKELDRNLNILKTQLTAIGAVLLTNITPAVTAFTTSLISNMKVLGTWNGLVNTFLQQFGQGVAVTTKQATEAILKQMNHLQELKSKYDGLDNALANSLREGLQKEINKLGVEFDNLTQAAAETNAETQRLLNLHPQGGGGNAIKPVTKEVKGAGKAAKEANDEWTQWLLSLLKTADAIAIVPKQVAYLTDQLNLLKAAGEQNSAWGQAIQETLKKLAGPEFISPVTKMFEDLRQATIDSATTFETIEVQLTAVMGKMAELEVAGRKTSEEFSQLAKKRDELLGLIDPIQKLVNEANALGKAAEEAAKRSSDMILALGSGKMTEGQFRLLAGGMKEISDQTKDLSVTFYEAGKAFTEQFVDKMVDGLGKSELSLADFAENFIKMIAKIMSNYVVQKFFTTFADMYLGTGGGAKPSAMGNAWNAAGLQFMASGGILNSPTLFRNQGRLAVAGEAGPEAVVPLSRMPSGDLGVSASPVNINVYNDNAATTQVTVSSADNTDGSKQVSIYVEQKVRSMFSSGQMDRTMNASYGLSRQPR